MTASSILIQFLNGLASASSLFLVAAGLSLIFGVTRIVNFAHGSLFMLGMYLAVALAPMLGFWMSVPLAALAVAAFGALVEALLLRRLYGAPELLQLLATFALVLVIKDFTLWAWGPEDILGPRAPGLAGAVTIAGRQFPEYDLFLILFGPLVLGALWFLLTRTRWGTLVRAATQDREMAGALGVNQRWLFTSVFALGALLAGLGGAVQIPREPATLFIDLQIISDAFVVVVVGGLGSIPGAFLAALLIAEIKSFCIGLGYSKITLVVEFIVMAVVLVIRPWGLLGRMPAQARGAGALEPPLVLPSRALLAALAAVAFGLALVPAVQTGYTLVLLTDMLLFALFAVSLHFIMGPGGLHSFGHAAYFGLGAYGAGLLVHKGGVPMEAALAAAPWLAALGALVFGWFCVRLSGVYLAMLTLAFAQIAWSVIFQWDAFTGGSNGIVGIWPVGLAVQQDRLLLPHARRLRRRHRAALARPLLAVRLRGARRPRFAAARGRHRHRRARAAMGGIHLRRTVRGPRRRPVRVLQGLHFARGAVGVAFGGRPGDGAARRHPDAHRAAVGRGAVHLAAGRGARAASTTGAR